MQPLVNYYFGILKLIPLILEKRIKYKICRSAFYNINFYGQITHYSNTLILLI